MRTICIPHHCAAHAQVNTSVQSAGPNQFFFTLEQVEGINHIVVFLTGELPFSDGFAGAIYFGWPGAGVEAGLDGVAWQFLGYISNDKPSAIFKLAKACVCTQ